MYLHGRPQQGEVLVTLQCPPLDAQLPVTPGPSVCRTYKDAVQVDLRAVIVLVVKLKPPTALVILKNSRIPPFKQHLP